MDGGYGIIRLSLATPMEVINAPNAKKDSHLKKTIAPTAVPEWTVTVMIKLLLAFIVGANFGVLVIALVKGGDG